MGRFGVMIYYGHDIFDSLTHFVFGSPTETPPMAIPSKILG
jgi:hypothetical protein